jgi:hypothetical protein
MEIVKCIGVEPKALDGLVLVIAAFGKVVIKMPTLAPLFFIKGPTVVLDAFIGSLSPDLPSFNTKIKIGDVEFPLKFKGKDLNSDFGLPVFSPEGLVSMILGLVNILVGLPELFFDEVLKTPKVPTYEGVLKLVGASLGLQIDPLILDARFVEKFTGCIVDIIMP